MNVVARVGVELRFQAYPNPLFTEGVPYTFTLKAPCSHHVVTSHIGDSLGLFGMGEERAVRQSQRCHQLIVALSFLVVRCFLSVISPGFVGLIAGYVPAILVANIASVDSSPLSSLVIHSAQISGLHCFTTLVWVR